MSQWKLDTWQVRGQSSWLTLTQISLGEEKREREANGGGGGEI